MQDGMNPSAMKTGRRRGVLWTCNLLFVTEGLTMLFISVLTMFSALEVGRIKVLTFEQFLYAWGACAILACVSLLTMWATTNGKLGNIDAMDSSHFVFIRIFNLAATSISTLVLVMGVILHMSYDVDSTSFDNRHDESVSTALSGPDSVDIRFFINWSSLQYTIFQSAAAVSILWILAALSHIFPKISSTSTVAINGRLGAASHRGSNGVRVVVNSNHTEMEALLGRSTARKR